MSRKAPQVIAGPRGAVATGETIRREPSTLVEIEPPSKPSLKPGEVHFRAKAPAYVCQITNPSDMYDPLTGRKTLGRPVKARFKNGDFITSDPAIIDAIKGSRDFGFGRDMWLASDEVEYNAQRTASVLIDQLEALPADAKARLREALGMETVKEHALPKLEEVAE